jgi:hypothetical protein
MYYLLMLLAASVRAVKTPHPDQQSALSSFDCVEVGGFQSLIFNPENGFGFRTIAT